MSRNSCVECGSSAVVGSSRIATLGRFIRISARPRRWRMPCEKVADPRLRDIAEPDAVERGGEALVDLAAGEAGRGAPV